MFIWPYTTIHPHVNNMLGDQYIMQLIEQPPQVQ